MHAEVDSLLSSFDEADDFMEPDGQLELKLTPDTAPTEDLRIGPYAIVSEIGRGGMGTVYKVHHLDDPLRQPLPSRLFGGGSTTSLCSGAFEQSEPSSPAGSPQHREPDRCGCNK